MKLLKMAELKKYFWVFVVIVLISGAGQTALATTYECNTEKVFIWRQDQLLPDDSLNARPNSILQFDDQTGILYTAFDKKSPFVPVHLKVMQQMDESGILGLAAIANETVNGQYISTNIFRLRKDKTEGIIFLQYLTLENRVAIGKCDITEKNHP